MMVEGPKFDPFLQDWTGTTYMDIKIGFTESPRELVIQVDGGRDEVVAKLTEGLQGGGGFVELADTKDRTYLINAGDVAYVEIGSENRPAVGFGGI